MFLFFLPTITRPEPSSSQGAQGWTHRARRGRGNPAWVRSLVAGGDASLRRGKGWRRVEEKGDYPAEATPASARVRRVGFQCYFTFFERSKVTKGTARWWPCLCLPCTAQRRKTQLSANFVISDLHIFMGWVNGGNITKKKKRLFLCQENVA